MKESLVCLDCGHVDLKPDPQEIARVRVYLAHLCNFCSKPTGHELLSVMLRNPNEPRKKGVTR